MNSAFGACCKIAYESLPINTHSKAVLSKDILITHQKSQLNHIVSYSNKSILVFSKAFPGLHNQALGLKMIHDICSKSINVYHCENYIINDVMHA